MYEKADRNVIVDVRKEKIQKKHIAVAVTNDLLTDQRVDRTCRTLAEAGYRVTLVGRRFRNSRTLPEREYQTNRMQLIFTKSALFYFEYNFRLFLRLLRLRPDAVWANDTDTLLACTLAARLLRRPLIFDAHELFPEVPELVGRPRVKAVWQWIEKKCLPHVKVAYTVCQSVAEEYQRRYGVEMHVVRNLQSGYSGSTQPPVGKADSIHNSVEQMEIPPTSCSNHNGHNILLYQGAVNVGRGVREAIDALEWLPEYRLVVAGDGDQRKELQAYTASLPWGERVTFTGRVEPQALHEITKSADLGLCLLEDLGLNYRYSLPNRVGDFIRAGVPLLATDFVEIRRVTEAYGTGALTEACPREKSGTGYHAYVRRLAEKIDETLKTWREMPASEREARFDRARRELCWEEEKKRLLAPLDTIF